MASLLLIASCAKSEKFEKNSRFYTINLDEQNSEQSIALSSIFNGVEPIVLETTDESLIGEVSKLEVSDDYLFVLDNSISRKLFVFDKIGKFVKTIGDQGRGPGEYDYLSDFTIDREHRFVYILDIGLQKINKYDIDSGGFISSISLKNPAYSAISVSNDRIYTDIYSEKVSENNALLQEIDIETGKQIATFLDVRKHNKTEHKGLLLESPGVFKCQSSPYPKFSQYLMDTIMILDKDGVKPFLAIESEHLLTPQHLLSWNIRGKWDIMKNMELIEKDKLIWNINNYVECDGLIFFNYLQGLAVKDVFYKPDKDWLYICNRESNDLVFKKDYQSSMVSRFISSDRKGIYSVVGGDNINILIDIASHNGLNDNLDRLDELKQLTEDSNPVLFYYEYEE
jgi:hypothetical protein